MNSCKETETNERIKNRLKIQEILVKIYATKQFEEIFLKLSKGNMRNYLKKIEKLN